MKAGADATIDVVFGLGGEVSALAGAFLRNPLARARHKLPAVFFLLI